MKMLFGLMGFLIINLYMNLVPRLFEVNRALSFMLYVCAFMVLVHWVAKLTGLRGVGALGLTGHYGWKRNMRIGILFGACLSGALYVYMAKLGVFQVGEMLAMPAAAAFLAKAFSVAIFVSLMNELVVRGYVFAHLKGKIHSVFLVLLAAVIYALDDVWLTEFNASQALASAVLGLSLGYVLLRTNSIWMSAGIGTGVSFVHSLFFGVPELASGNGLFVVVFDEGSSHLMNMAESYASLVLLIVILLVYDRMRINKAAKE
ncbi:CPBP family intramembrane glutamic endopeptidase [Paenibacillus sinopodophylli]|uniref:CPBP family intramembrane glutamic endopeptidase n=1 Tax=Paenibacillus sinopodophylli TaxID=1837342 RepID=UPI00110CCC39|nr:CPBP family intramembrane glutamic endopeptidase [Paenibacillus sinopodophylli]